MAPSNDDLLKFYRSEIKFQNDLLSSRLSSLMTSQSFLLIAYASGGSGLVGKWSDPLSLLFLPFLALLGIVLSLQARPGIAAAYAMIDLWRRRQQELLSENHDLKAFNLAPVLKDVDQDPEEYFRGRAKAGSLFARQVPWVFAVAWCYLAALPLLLHVTAGR